MQFVSAMNKTRGHITEFYMWEIPDPQLLSMTLSGPQGFLLENLWHPKKLAALL